MPTPQPLPLSRVGDIVDTTGEVEDALVPSVMANLIPIGVVGSRVTPHKTHNHAHMSEGSPNVFAGAGVIPVCRLYDYADCGHTEHTGSPNVFVNLGVPQPEPPDTFVVSVRIIASSTIVT